MISLVIDTCTEKSSIAFVEQKEGLFQLFHCIELPFGRQSSSYLLPKLEEAFKRIGKRPHDMERIIVTAGPGSYTGLRAGVVVAKTLSYVCRVPLVGISSLEGLIPFEEGSFVAILDAKMAGCYLLRGEQKGKMIHRELPQVATLEEAREILKDVKWVVSPDTTILQEKLYPNKLKSWDSGLAKASGSDLPKSTQYCNMGSISEVESRELSLKSETNFSTCLGIALPQLKWVERGADHICLAQLGEEKFLKGEYSVDGSLEILYMR